MDFKQFLEWERATRDTLDVKLIYMDIAGDFTAGVMLSEIIYWYLPSKDGKPNKMVVIHEGKEWIAVPRWEWWERIRLSPRQADEALSKLIDAGLITKDRFKFNGEVTVHIRLDEKKFIGMFDHLSANPLENPYKPKRGENGFVEIRKIDLSDSVKSTSRKSTNPITETTTQNTTETKKKRTAPHGAASTLSPSKSKTDASTESVNQGQEPAPIPPIASAPLSPSAAEIVAILDGWIAGLAAPPIPLPYANKGYRGMAAELVKRGVTPEQVTRFTKLRSAEDYWYGKQLPFKTVANDIGVWLASLPVSVRHSMDAPAPKPANETPPDDLISDEERAQLDADLNDLALFFTKPMRERR